MEAAAHGHSTLGIPKSVGEEFVGDAAAGPSGMAAGVVFVDPTGHVLLLRRSSDDQNFPGHWDLPGGKADAGETPEEAAEREAKEEVGPWEPDGAIKRLYSKKTPRGMVFHTFAQPVKRRFAPKLSAEHSGFAWAPPGQLPGPLHPGVEDDLGEHIGAAEDMTPEDWTALRDNFAKWTREEEAEPEHADDAEGKAAGAFSEKDKEAASSHVKHREDMPKSAFLLPGERKYPVKEKKNGEWQYDRELLLAAAREARMHGRKDIAERADAIRGRMGTATDNLPAEVAALAKGWMDAGAPVALAMDWAANLESLFPHYRPAGGVVAFDRESVREKDVDGRLHVKTANISKACVNPYLGREIPDYEQLGLDPDHVYKLLRDPEELKKAAPTFNNLPLLDDHVAVNADDHRPERVVGSLGTDASYEHPFLKNSLVVWARHGIDGVESDEQKEISCSYRYAADMTPGTYEGEPYDGVMRSIVGNHAALVKKGRAGSDVVVGDSSIEESKMAGKLTRMGVYTVGVLAAALTPKLAKDAALDLSPMLAKLEPGKTLKDSKPAILASMKTLKGLAKDANLDDVTALLDKLEKAEKVEGMDDLQPNSAPMMSASGQEAEDPDAMDEGGQKALEFMKGKGMSEDDCKAVMDMLRPKAADEDETAEEKAKREKEEADKKAADEAAAKKDEEDKVDKKAMDAAIKIAVEGAKRDAIKLANDIAAAREHVEPWVGKIKTTVAFDSAEAVYGKALEMLGVSTKDMPPAAFRPVLDAQPKQGDGQRRTVTANDAAVDAKGFAERFPEAARF